MNADLRPGVIVTSLDTEHPGTWVVLAAPNMLPGSTLKVPVARSCAPVGLLVESAYLSVFDLVVVVSA
jgi:hypothetical protein